MPLLHSLFAALKGKQQQQRQQKPSRIRKKQLGMAPAKAKLTEGFEIQFKVSRDRCSFSIKISKNYATKNMNMIPSLGIHALCNPLSLDAEKKRFSWGIFQR